MLQAVIRKTEDGFYQGGVRSILGSGENQKVNWTDWLDIKRLTDDDAWDDAMFTITYDYGGPFGSEH